MKLRARTWAASLLLVGALAVPALAITLQQPLSTVLVPGADRWGNPSLIQGGYGPGKIYKDRRTGIINVEVKANVGNASGGSVKFRDLGFIIYDPWAETYVISDRDKTILGRPKHGVSEGSLHAVSHP